MNHLRIDTDKCIGCGKCVKICMKDNIVVENRKARETGAGCLECSHCVSTCPKGAITLLHKSEEASGFFDGIKRSKMFDGGMVSDEDLETLYQAMDHGKRRCELFTLAGDELDDLMETVWEIVKDKEADLPIVKEWAAWREENDVLKPSPMVWKGKQVLFIFADSPDRAFIASNRMIAKGLDLGIRGYHFNLIMLAYSIDRNSILMHFPHSSKELYMTYVIGHARRLVEPIFKPMEKLKGIFNN